MRVALVLLLVAGALALGYLLARGQREPVPGRRLDREVVQLPVEPQKEPVREDSDHLSAAGVLRSIRAADPEGKRLLMGFWTANGAREPGSGAALLELLRREDDPQLRLLIGDLAAACESLSLTAEQVDEVLGMLRDGEEPELRYAAARFSRAVWALEEGRDDAIRAWLPIARHRIEDDDDLRVVTALAELIGDHLGATDEIVAALRERKDRLPPGADHRALLLALAKDDIRMRYETVDGEQVLLPTPRWEHFYAQWERARSDDLREDHARVIAGFLQTLGPRVGVDRAQAKAILEQCATMYGRTARKETRAELVGALWKEQGGRFRAGALDTLIALEPDSGLGHRLRLLRTAIEQGRVADLADVLALLRTPEPSPFGLARMPTDDER